MIEDQFTKLFKYIEKRFDTVDKQFKQNNAEHQEMIVFIVKLNYLAD